MIAEKKGGGTGEVSGMCKKESFWKQKKDINGDTVQWSAL
jgi:hypothetical protein